MPAPRGERRFRALQNSSLEFGVLFESIVSGLLQFFDGGSRLVLERLSQLEGDVSRPFRGLESVLEGDSVRIT